ncbi:MAG: polysaccharide deacetylase family protein [Treponema sp.]|jgi:peptidoglycan/xylan/chitin deacetylase (PgdA/CDA1 family)|nr:polysaccharide deacetylase family protein [Treponema sp.]
MAKFPLWLIIPVLLLPAVKSAAKVNFSAPDVSDDDRLLLWAGSDNNGAHSQGILLLSRLTDMSIRQLTAFPEKMDLVENGGTLQVRNAFGVVRIPLSGGLPRHIPGFSSFSGGSPVLGGRVEEMAASADGKWLLYVEPVTAAYGNLILLDTVSGEKTSIAARVERPDRFFPACWSPNSRLFVYAKGGKLYYYTVGAPVLASMGEQYRLIGEGAVNSVAWGRGGDFFYLRNSTVFRVRSEELFARALYAGFLEIGSMAGKIPWDFDPSFDSFWIGPESQSILLAKGGRNIFYYPLGMDDYEAGSQASLPYVMIPRASSALSVLWAPGGLVTVIASIPRKNETELLIYRLHINGDGGELLFTALESPGGSRGILSPDGTKALFWGEKGIVLYDYSSWKLLKTLGTSPAFSCIWVNGSELIAGDVEGIRLVRLSGAPPPRLILGQGAAAEPAESPELKVQQNLICLSSAAQFGFEQEGNRIFARSGGAWFVTDGTAPWTGITGPAVRESSASSSRYRVYLDKQSSGPYGNLPMVRSLDPVGTVSLFPAIEYLRPAAAGEKDRTPGLFTHGLRDGLREVALCFDLYDDATGLSVVLDTLNRFGIRATFFLNGEFIRRYPAAARDIAEAGHETASMFFAPIDISDARYRIDPDFISRGLARNEDEFFRAAGSELSLLWHPPYYAASPEIIAAAAAAGYKTVGRDTDPQDWVSQDESKRIGITQYSASDMIDLIMETKRPGSVIPVRLGLLPGGRKDYLFNRLDVLLDALVRSGYEVAPVSAVMEHAR